MEEISRTPMITLELKTSLGVDFSNPVRRYIRDYYREDPDTYSDEIARLKQLRANAIAPNRDYSGCGVLRRYFCQLHFLEARFPMKEGEAAAIPFSWTDVLSGKSVSVSDISYDQAATLYNLGALHSQLGDYDSRTTDDGMRVSCTHFQCAAGAFDYLKEHFPVAATPDLGSELMAMYTSLMLAQAQECLLEKSIKERKRGSISSKLARQVADFYSTALLLAESQTIAQTAAKKSKVWQKHFKGKGLYFSSLAMMFGASASAEQDKHGEEVGYLKAAAAKIEEAAKLTKDEVKLKEAVKLVAETVSKMLESAVKNNDFVYHEPVPRPDALPEITGTSLVKPIPFQPSDPSVSGHDIFAKLIPMEAHELSSVYSEEKARLLRHVGSLIEGKDAELTRTLEALSLEDVLKPHSVPDSLPPQLDAKYQDMKDKKEALASLKDTLDELETVSAKAKTSLDQAEALLLEDEKQEKLITERFGARPQSKDSADLQAEVKQYQEAHAKGMTTNSDVLEKFSQNQSHFDHLTNSKDALLASLPTQSLLDSPIDEEVVENLQRLMGKVDQMKSQRKQLVSELREKISKDDITSQIVTAEDHDKDDFFSKELEKHNETIDLIRQNLDAQDRILAALTEANAKYATVRQTLQEIDEQREQTIEQIISAAEMFPTLEARADKGLGFFKRLDEKTSELLERVRDVCANRQRERPSMEPPKAVVPDSQSSPQGWMPPSQETTRPHAPTRASLPPKPSHLVGPPPPAAPTATSALTPAMVSYPPSSRFSTSSDSFHNLTLTEPSFRLPGPSEAASWSPLTSMVGVQGPRAMAPSSERVVIGQSQFDATAVSEGGSRIAKEPVRPGSTSLPNSALHKAAIDLEDQLKALSQKSPSDNLYGVTRDWEALGAFEVNDTKSFTLHAARANSQKNHSDDSVPYDCNRVKLRGVSADYINASHLEDLFPPHIAAQSPSPNGVEDFWTMVWECKVPVIVMLDREIEGGRVVCHRYWPEGGGHMLKFGPLEVTLQNHQETDVCVARSICMRNAKDNEERSVTHLEYRDWPEIGVPQSPQSFCEFLLQAMAIYRRKARRAEPMVVQSRDGGSRVGVFVVLHTAMRSVESGAPRVSVFNLVRALRKQRMHTIQTKEQYIFCHSALLFFARRLQSNPTTPTPSPLPVNAGRNQSRTEPPPPPREPRPHPPTTATPEIRSTDPLNSLNPFWKVGVKEKKPEDLGSLNEFDPLKSTSSLPSAATMAAAATTTTAAAATTAPSSTANAYSAYESVETSSGNVVSVRAGVVPSARERSTNVVVTEHPVSQIPPLMTSLLGQKEKQIEMQALKIVEQDRVIKDQGRRIGELEMIIRDLRHQFGECRQLAEEKQRLVEEMKNKLMGNQSLEAQLEQLKSMVLVQKKQQEEQRQEDKQYQQKLQHQLHMQQLEINKQMEDQRRQEVERKRLLEQQQQQQPIQQQPIQQQPIQQQPIQMSPGVIPPGNQPSWDTKGVAVLQPVLPRPLPVQTPQMAHASQIPPQQRVPGPQQQYQLPSPGPTAIGGSLQMIEPQHQTFNHRSNEPQQYHQPVQMGQPAPGMVPYQHRGMALTHQGHPPQQLRYSKPITVQSGQPTGPSVQPARYPATQFQPVSHPGQMLQQPPQGRRT